MSGVRSKALQELVGARTDGKNETDTTNVTDEQTLSAVGSAGIERMNS